MWRNIILVLGAVVWCATSVLANTEIVNFEVVRSSVISLPSQSVNWTVLSPEHPEKLLIIQPARLRTPLQDVCTQYPSGSPCPHELWFILDLDDAPWQQYAKLTLRISWPASSPVDFSIEVDSPVSLLSTSTAQDSGNGTTTRQMLARIRAVDTGVRTPSLDVTINSHTLELLAEPVSFIVIVEPLYLNVLPASVLLIVLFLVPVIGVAAFIVAPFANDYLENIARQARAEIDVAEKKTS
ncbi:hypothetical protein WOLCODRAFT_87422 [Wolfiporia cocos MD-104 SS10]|uniref:Uncharacterized protein n=1 Tax=Wolfiporia cocos (strain MD-104) TaxID=742152 RepID=A0A2H3JCD0_WOLCO|nr:hypothetical protein WOLCODRAFT_87422 [Wolfiporia cocos MD-104 SS10]